jgi:hypothetical protein
MVARRMKIGGSTVGMKIGGSTVAILACERVGCRRGPAGDLPLAA